MQDFPIPTLPVFKAGDTFSVAGFAGIGLGWTATCQLRDQLKNLVANVDVVLGTATVLDEDNDTVLPILLFKDATETVNWRTGFMDIAWSDTSGAVVHTSTFKLPVEQPITRTV